MLFLLATALLTTLARFQQLHAALSSSSSLAGATATHFLTVTLTNYSLPAGSYLYLNYSAGWTLSGASRANNGDFCENGCTLGSIALTVSGNNVRINNLFPAALVMGFVSVGLSIQGIINPKLALSDTLTLDVFNGGGALLQSTSIGVTINPSAMTCAATPANSTVTASTIYTFTVTPSPSLPLPNLGSLELIFPSLWSSSLLGPAFSLTACSNPGSTISCTASGSTITASSLFSSGTTTAPFSFSVDSVINPGST
jgi:hypothetical protein